VRITFIVEWGPSSDLNTSRIITVSFEAPPSIVSRVSVETPSTPLSIPRFPESAEPEYEDAWPYPHPSDPTDTRSSEPRLNPKYWIHYAHSPEYSTDESGNPMLTIGSIFEPWVINWKAYRRKEKYDGDLFHWKPNTPERQRQAREALEKLMQTWMKLTDSSAEDASAFLACFPDWVRSFDVCPETVLYIEDIFFANGSLNEIIRWDVSTKSWKHETLPLRPRRASSIGNVPEWNRVVDWDTFDWTLRHVYRIKSSSS
jgi:hypothetical protein